MEDNIKKLLQDHHRNYRRFFWFKIKRSLAFVVKKFPSFFFYTPSTFSTNKEFVPINLYLSKRISEAHDLSDFFQPEIFPVPIGDRKLSLFHEFYLLNLAYLFHSFPLGKFFFCKAYKRLKAKLRGKPILVFNSSPSLLSSLLTYYCEYTEGSRFIIIQHGIYQLNHVPYFYQFGLSSVETWVWSEMLRENYRKRFGMKKIELLPTYLFSEVKKEEEIELDAPIYFLIVGEGFNRVNKQFNVDYYNSLKSLMSHLKTALGERVRTVFYKPHPRMTERGFWIGRCKLNGWKVVSTIPSIDDGRLIVIGKISTLLIQMLVEGYRCIQVNDESLKGRYPFDDYTQFSSIISSQSLTINKEEAALLLYNRRRVDIDEKYLLINSDWENEYSRKIQRVICDLLPSD